MRCVISCGSTSFPWLVFFFGAPAVRVHDSQAYRKMDVTREHISCILELREYSLLSLQTGFNLVNAAVVCAILESILGLEPSSVITEPRYLKLVTVSIFCPFTLISVFMPLVFFVISLVSRYWSPCHRLWRLCLDVQLILPVLLPLLLSHRCHQQSGDWWLLCPNTYGALWSCKTSVMILSRNMLKRVGGSRHTCRTPTAVRNQSPMML